LTYDSEGFIAFTYLKAIYDNWCEKEGIKNCKLTSKLKSEILSYATNIYGIKITQGRKCEPWCEENGIEHLTQRHGFYGLRMKNEKDLSFNESIKDKKFDMDPYIKAAPILF